MPRDGAVFRIMLCTLIMTFMGEDRPGIVQLLSSCVSEHGGNWLESRMCRLGGQFTGVARAEVPLDKVGDLKQALKELKGIGLKLSIHTEKHTVPPVDPEFMAEIELVGYDRRNIVRDITTVLVDHGVNVEEFASNRIPSTTEGPALFRAEAVVLLPRELALDALRRELEHVALGLLVEVQLRRPRYDKQSRAAQPVMG